MSNYYGTEPHLPRRELRHSGKEGMRWGISNNPWYKPVGHLAKGILKNGRYIYENVRNGNAFRSVRNRLSTLPGRIGGAANRAFKYVTGGNIRDAEDRINRASAGYLRAENDAGRARWKDAQKKGLEMRKNARSLGRDVENVVNRVKDGSVARGAGKAVGDAMDYITGSRKQRAKEYRDRLLQRISIEKDPKEKAKLRELLKGANQAYSNARSLGMDVGNAFNDARKFGRGVGRAIGNGIGSASRSVRAFLKRLFNPEGYRAGVQRTANKMAGAARTIGNNVKAKRKLNADTETYKRTRNAADDPRLYGLRNSGSASKKSSAPVYVSNTTRDVLNKTLFKSMNKKRKGSSRGGRA